MDLEDKNVYVISLDAVDLNLLHSSIKRSYDKPTPLWPRKNLELRSDDVYEFKIKTKEEKNDDVEKRIEFMTCHICDIEVPKIYYNEHKASFRHSFNSKVTEVALKRVQKQMSFDFIANGETNPLNYYCQECCTIVDRKDELNHKKSVMHKNSIMFEKFLNDFLDYFTDTTDMISSEDNDISIAKTQDTATKKVEEDNSNEHIRIENVKTEQEILNENSSVKNENVHRNFDGNKTKKNINVLNNDETEKLEKVNGNSVTADSIEKVSKISNVSTDTKILDTTANVTEDNNKNVVKIDSKTEENMTSYISLLNEKYDLKPMMLRANNENFEIKTIDGSYVRIHFDNFHALKEIGYMVHCLVCEKIFNLNDINNHIMEENHMKFISIQLKDKHCIREINEDRLHCVVCNTIVELLDIHVHYNREHDICIKEVLLKDFTQNQSDTNTGDRSLFVDILKGDKSNKKIVSKEEVNQLINTNSNKHFCVACNVSIGVRRIKKHEGTNKHIQNCKSDYHYMITTLDNCDTMCLICSIIIKNDVHGLKEHFQSFFHICNYEKFMKLSFLTKINKDTLYCNKCCVYMLNKNELLHANSKQHKNQVNFGKTNLNFDADSIASTENDSDTSSKPNSDKTVESIINVNAAIEVEVKCDKKSIAEFNGSVKDETIPDKGNENFDKRINTIVNNNNYERNDVGECSSTNNANSDNYNVSKNANVTEIVQAAKHIVSEPKVDLNYHFCVICQVKVPKNENNIKMHDLGKLHLQKLATKGAKVQIQPLVAKANMFSHYHMKLTSYNVMTCMVCDVSLTVNEANIVTHVNGSGHSINYAQFLSKNFVTVTGDKVYCMVCKVSCGARCEFSHCVGKRHQTNLETEMLRLSKNDHVE